MVFTRPVSAEKLITEIIADNNVTTEVSNSNTMVCCCTSTRDSSIPPPQSDKCPCVVPILCPRPTWHFFPRKHARIAQEIHNQRSCPQNQTLLRASRLQPSCHGRHNRSGELNCDGARLCWALFNLGKWSGEAVRHFGTAPTAWCMVQAIAAQLAPHRQGTKDRFISLE